MSAEVAPFAEAAAQVERRRAERALALSDYAALLSVCCLPVFLMCAVGACARDALWSAWGWRS